MRRMLAVAAVGALLVCALSPALAQVAADDPEGSAVLALRDAAVKWVKGRVVTAQTMYMERGFLMTVEEAQGFYNSPEYADMARTWELFLGDKRDYPGSVKPPVILRREEDPALPGNRPAWTDWNRVATGVVTIAGRGVQPFWLVQGFTGTVQYPAVVATADDMVDVTRPPRELSLSRPAQVRLWGQYGRHRPLSRTQPTLAAISFNPRRFVWVFGISTSRLGDDAVPEEDENRAYFIGTAYMVNPYVSLLAGVNSVQWWPPSIGVSLDLGILKVGE